jgi:hypothetical protein
MQDFKYGVGDGIHSRGVELPRWGGDAEPWLGDAVEKVISIV